MMLFCDNKSTINKARNLVQYDQTKCIKVDKHFIKDKLDRVNLYCICAHKKTAYGYSHQTIGQPDF